jgi:hypothetical protein
VAEEETRSTSGKSALEITAFVVCVPGHKS